MCDCANQRRRKHAERRFADSKYSWRCIRRNLLFCRFFCSTATWCFSRLTTEPEEQVSTSLFTKRAYEFNSKPMIGNSNCFILFFFYKHQFINVNPFWIGGALNHQLLKHEGGIFRALWISFRIHNLYLNPSPSSLHIQISITVIRADPPPLSLQESGINGRSYRDVRGFERGRCSGRRPVWSLNGTEII